MFLWENAKAAWAGRGWEDSGYTKPMGPEGPERLTAGTALPSDEFGQADGTQDGGSGTCKSGSAEKVYFSRAFLARAIPSAFFRLRRISSQMET